MIARILVVVAALAVGIVIGVVVTRSGDDKHAATSATTTSLAPLSIEGRHLVDALNAGRQATFHAHYKVAATSSSGQNIELELWRRGADLRQDTFVSGGSQPAGHTASFFHGDVVTTCTQPVNGPWKCAPGAAGQQGGPDALVEQLTEQLAGVDVKASEETINGIPSRCYLLEITSDAAKVCVRDDGVPTLIASGQQQLELTSIDGNVTDDVFHEPAPVV